MLIRNLMVPIKNIVIKQSGFVASANKLRTLFWIVTLQMLFTCLGILI